MKLSILIVTLVAGTVLSQRGILGGFTFETSCPDDNERRNPFKNLKTFENHASLFGENNKNVLLYSYAYQVVAGTNVFTVFESKDSKGNTKYLGVKVYVNLSGEESLTKAVLAQSIDEIDQAFEIPNFPKEGLNCSQKKEEPPKQPHPKPDPDCPVDKNPPQPPTRPILIHPPIIRYPIFRPPILHTVYHPPYQNWGSSWNQQEYPVEKPHVYVGSSETD